jgi:hypothetical protein
LGLGYDDGFGVFLGVTNMVWWLLKIVEKRCSDRRGYENERKI